MAEIGLMASHDGRRLFCAKGVCDELRTFRNLLCYASVFGVRVAVEPSIGVLCEKGQINEGRVSGALGLPGLPASAEYLAVEMCLTLAAEFGTPLHLHGLSCRASADKVRAAKAAGQNVTCDVTAVNLILDETEYTIERLRGDLKVWPAVRTADDRAALWAALDDGTVDAVTSGYCARSSDDLALCFEEIPFGSERMETLPADLLNAWEAQGRPARVQQLLAALSDGPRKILGTDALSRNIAGTTVASRDEFGWHVRYENKNGGTR